MGHLNTAKSLDEAIRLLKFTDLRIGLGVVGPKGKIEFRRISCQQGLGYRAEVLISEVGSTNNLLTLVWNRKEKKWDSDWEKTQLVMKNYKDLW